MQDLERVAKRAASLAAARRGVEEYRQLHGVAGEGCRIEPAKSSRAARLRRAHRGTGCDCYRGLAQTFHFRSARRRSAARDLADPEGLRQPDGRPKKMKATCLIDHKLSYNEKVSPPQSRGCRVLGPSADG
jgi:hypothetical protein